MYPPMGFVPLGNEDEGLADGARIDEVLRQLYTWCVDEDVPIIVHGNPSNFADPAFEAFSSPERWGVVLTDFPGLRLNLGHFGGAREDEDPNGWPWRIARLTGRFPNLYADVGNHRIHDDDVTEAYLAMLARMFGGDAEMARRLMWGSDWYMLALHPDHEDFLDDYEEAYRGRFGDERTADFLGSNALRYLGFDDGVNLNARRVARRYEDIGEPKPDWLA
jgi:predicted TIM-barrel fold metal-dependent hydrolase